MKKVSTKYSSKESKYYYPGTDILKNKMNIRDEMDLIRADSTLPAYRVFELQTKPLEGNFDLQHLIDIHYYIFQDLYYFAGKIREEDITKGTTLFAISKYIVPYANKLFKELKEENFLIGRSLAEFAERVSYYLAELNILHPFREGNGRAIREFIRCLALKCGHIINWDLVSKDELLNASIKSVSDLKPLIHCIKKAIESQ